ncbi:hypothetical protein PHMEG_00015837 [Phytophthora megakarya]|uniref:Uncharacterized protein n=1 Tax=Phytophthora megakarya TaxID=4795 RepID=A0A225W0R2_9STRA|nr:hypothetical protein PHMEG_00015837 [Phytophthora megakarya]
MYALALEDIGNGRLSFKRIPYLPKPRLVRWPNPREWQTLIYENTISAKAEARVMAQSPKGLWAHEGELAYYQVW